MQPPALCVPAGLRPNRWETLSALQSPLPLLRKTADTVHWFEQADAETANIIRGRPSDTAKIPALIARSPQNKHHAPGFEGNRK